MLLFCAGHLWLNGVEESQALRIDLSVVCENAVTSAVFGRSFVLNLILNLIEGVWYSVSVFISALEVRQWYFCVLGTCS